MIREIFHHEGGVSAFYRGLTSNIIGNSISWGVYFFCYSNIKDAMQGSRGSTNQELTSTDYFVASGTAGMNDLYGPLFCLGDCPVWYNS